MPGGLRSFFLRTERLGFGQWAEADRELATGLWGDAEVTRLIGQALSPAEVEARLAREIANQKSLGFQYWPIFLLETGAHVGCCGLRPYKPSARILELGFALRREFRGQGLAAEAANGAIAHAFDALGAAALFAGHHPENEVSRRLLTKLGFEYTHDEFYPPTGLMHPSYALTEARYRSRPRT